MLNKLLLVAATVVTCATPIAATACHSNERAPAAVGEKSVDSVGFRSFWATFRRALLSTDVNALEQLTRLPLVLRGERDEDPVKQIAKGQLAELIGKLLQQDTGLSAKPEPVRDYIERFEAPPPDANAAGSDFARVTAFVFERHAGKWELTQAYLSQDPQ
jgi:hypothetical protein